LSTPDIPVKITVKTTIDQQDTFELLLFGRYYEKGHASFLQYEEVMEEGSVRTIVKVAAGEGLILRSGAVKMRLPFQLNRKMTGSYEMPFGRFETRTLAKKIDHSYQNGKGRIDIVYDFTMQEEPAGTYHLEITFQEEMK
jgi:uncharacterized beta-barrel protein YwiB (DUF1934 family)